MPVLDPRKIAYMIHVGLLYKQGEPHNCKGNKIIIILSVFAIYSSILTGLGKSESVIVVFIIEEQHALKWFVD